MYNVCIDVVTIELYRFCLPITDRPPFRLLETPSYRRVLLFYLLSARNSSIMLASVALLKSPLLGFLYPLLYCRRAVHLFSTTAQRLLHTHFYRANKGLITYPFYRRAFLVSSLPQFDFSAPSSYASRIESAPFAFTAS